MREMDYTPQEENSIIVNQFSGIIKKYFDENEDEFPRIANSYSIIDRNQLMKLTVRLTSQQNTNPSRLDILEDIIDYMSGRKSDKESKFELFNNKAINEYHKKEIMKLLIAKIVSILGIKNREIERRFVKR